jgi:hypothetical protein
MTTARVRDQEMTFRRWLAELDDDSRAPFQQFLEIAATFYQAIVRLIEGRSADRFRCSQTQTH